MQKEREKQFYCKQHPGSEHRSPDHYNIPYLSFHPSAELPKDLILTQSKGQSDKTPITLDAISVSP